MNELKPVLLIGGMPVPDCETAFKACSAEIGKHLSSMPDGEPGDRKLWITFLAYRLYDGHPDIETCVRPRQVRGTEDWIPKGYDDNWQFRIREGLSQLAFDSLGYARAAADSYRTFCALREEGVVPRDVRFQVCLPLPESGTRPFVANADDFPRFFGAYQAAMVKELSKLSKAIPPSDLAIQWDVCVEVLAMESDDRVPYRPDSWRGAGDPFERYMKAVTELSPHVPEEAILGIHLCYGSLGNKHLIEPRDLALLTRMANASVERVQRRIDYFHMPVPQSRTDSAYFEPLADLDLKDAKLYAGLIHYADGVEGAAARLKALQRHYRSEVGIATECGMGRIPPEQDFPTFLKLHAAAAERLLN